MQYDHSRKAGNPGDVWKHFFLVELAKILPKSSAKYSYVESHCGAPFHTLTDQGEWQRGIGALVEDTLCDFRYTSVARQWLKDNRYPAGWVFMASELAKRFDTVELNLFDTSDKVASTYSPLAENIAPSNVEVVFHQQDGFERVGGMEGADLVFLDPPFYPDAEADWQLLSATCAELKANSTNYVVWYPIDGSNRVQEFVDMVLGVVFEVHWEAGFSGRESKLKGCGMLVSEELIPLIKAMDTKLQKIAGCMKSRLVIRKGEGVDL